MTKQEEYQNLLKKLDDTDINANVLFHFAKDQKQIDYAVKLKKHAMRLSDMAHALYKELNKNNKELQ